MPRLVIRKGDGVGKDHALGSPCVVGRHASANFVLGDEQASRNHFRITCDAGGWVLEDLGSTNGTLLNGRRITREALRDGDRIVAGGTELEFVQKDLLGSAPRAAAPAAVPARPAVRPLAAPPAARPPVAPALPAAPVTRSVPAVPAPIAVRPPSALPAPASRPASAPAPTPPAPPGKLRPQAPIPSKKRR
jgi:hypothetical protein